MVAIVAGHKQRVNWRTWCHQSTQIRSCSVGIPFTTEIGYIMKGLRIYIYIGMR